MYLPLFGGWQMLNGFFTVIRTSIIATHRHRDGKEHPEHLHTWKYRRFINFPRRKGGLYDLPSIFKAGIPSSALISNR